MRYINVLLLPLKYYRIATATRTVRIKQEIPQAVCYKLVVTETVWLDDVRMGSNDYLHAKRHQVFVYAMLVGNWS